MPGVAPAASQEVLIFFAGHSFHGSYVCGAWWAQCAHVLIFDFSAARHPRFLVYSEIIFCTGFDGGWRPQRHDRHAGGYGGPDHDLGPASPGLATFGGLRSPPSRRIKINMLEDAVDLRPSGGGNWLRLKWPSGVRAWLRFSWLCGVRPLRFVAVEVWLFNLLVRPRYE